MLDVDNAAGLPVWPAILILGYVTLQRVFELWFARRNTARLKLRGAVEIAPAHYFLIVAMHMAWLALLWVTAPGEPVDLVLLGVFAAIQLLRIWTLASIGRRWTTRIIVLRGETLVRRGPYRFLRHPNYLVVALEIAILPCVFQLYAIAILFTLLNAGAMAIRIPAESRALADYSANHPEG
ncbi:isoprenylcysteine carboxylmethyltransferase family protein [Fulvimarina sp. 2208YS6-2-32]|uniref:Isoprenylcysteine carboxylmethyltransferase family protein n=1 Tax=Fulvimarina uroteuthidis TaxID=3098149 RepID=A0ABU5I349_9HYPH|nr:isoprenylcysteine carboxylmethyltransferase family protein [Fulvimarina sp. 2208YS6-2-32]MDY8109787.1 isoprenylcysteine carboxylmethyltransferase family protein [Fulvimarina sp. 2208YS6-2-32]